MARDFEKIRLVPIITVLLVSGFLLTSLASFFVSDVTKTYYHADGVLKHVSPDDPLDSWYFG